MALPWRQPGAISESTMNRHLVLCLAVALMLTTFGADAGTTAATAAAPAAKATAPMAAATTRCHDARGKFGKCDTVKTVVAVRCRDDKGKFIACAK
jgi:hypothetical protein